MPTTFSCATSQKRKGKWQLKEVTEARGTNKVSQEQQQQELQLYFEIMNRIQQQYIPEHEKCYPY